MEAGGPLQASVRLLSGGDRDEDGKSTTPEAQPQNRAQQLQLGGRLSLTTRVGLTLAGGTLVPDHCIRAMRVCHCALINKKSKPRHLVCQGASGICACAMCSSRVCSLLGHLIPGF